MKLVIVSGILWSVSQGISTIGLWLQHPLEAMVPILLMVQSTGEFEIISHKEFVNIWYWQFDLNLFLPPLPSGHYGPDVNVDKLKDFHRRRLQIFVDASPDLLAFETIPNKLEAQVCSMPILYHLNCGLMIYSLLPLQWWYRYKLCCYALVWVIKYFSKQLTIYFIICFEFISCLFQGIEVIWWPSGVNGGTMDH